MKFEIEYTEYFLKKYKKFIRNNSKLEKRIKSRIDLFQYDPYHNSLHSHKLSGKLKDLFSFSITGDIRIAYYWEGNIAVFIDIDTHDNLYG